MNSEQKSNAGPDEKPNDELVKRLVEPFKLDVSFRGIEPWENCLKKIGFGKNHD